MSAFLVSVLPWTRALHVISVISWMAGLLYLPRLYVYHCAVEKGGAADLMLQTMERRLLRGIMNPAMIATIFFGLCLLATPGTVNWSHGWIHAKLALVVVLAGTHGMMARWRRDFAAGTNRRPARFYRIVNEVPTVIMIAIVILVIVRPF